VPRVSDDGVLPCSMDFDESGPLAIFRTKGGVGWHKRAQVMVELGWLHIELLMVAVCESTCGWFWCSRRGRREEFL
jgi:hypothetical protein